MAKRGAAFNPANRFEQILIERDEDVSVEDYLTPKTEFFRDL